MNRKCKIYAISDIHNDYVHFKAMWTKIKLRSEDLLIILGDIFDRCPDKPQPVELYNFIKNRNNIKFIRGNHDMWLAQHLIDDISNNKITYDYYNTYNLLRKNLSDVECLELANWILSCPLQMDIKCNERNFLLAHAATSIETRQEDYYLMGSDMFYESEGVEGFVSIVGHTPTKNLRFFYNNQLDKQDMNRIWYSTNNQIIVIDCGNAYRKENGILGCLRINDYKEYYV